MYLRNLIFVIASLSTASANLDPQVQVQPSTKSPVLIFTAETAQAKVKKAQDLWNTQ
jgi:hypothetical protein